MSEILNVTCVKCGRPIMEGDAHHINQYGIIAHINCHVAEIEKEGESLHAELVSTPTDSVKQLDPKIAAVEELRDLLVKLTAVVEARDPRAAAYKAMGGLYCMRDISLQSNHTVRFTVRWDVEAARDMCINLAQSLLEHASKLNEALAKQDFLKGV